jgi:predicted NBD/HSP70 family sugar kinase
MPGLIDSKNGINKTYFPIDKPLAAIFSEKFELPVLIENDAKARAFAELRFGGARNMKNVLVLHLDWGLGLGIIVNGKLYKGKNGFSGEFGHLPMVENGVLCKCGKQGCLETIASGTAIARMAREGIKAGRSSMLSTLVQEDLDKIETQTVVQAAVSGDQYTISILANVGFWLGKGLAYLIQIFNPELIILGGRMAEANQFLLTPVQQAIHTFCNPDLGNEIQIRFSELGSNAAIQGIAAMVLENELDKV